MNVRRQLILDASEIAGNGRAVCGMVRLIIAAAKEIIGHAVVCGARTRAVLEGRRGHVGPSTRRVDHTGEADRDVEGVAAIEVRDDELRSRAEIAWLYGDVQDPTDQEER